MNGRMAGAALVVVVAAGGCGASAKPLTRAEFVTKGNAVCRGVNARVNRGIAPFAMALKRRDTAGAVRAFERLLGVEKDGLKDLGGLVPPRLLRRTYERYMGVQRARIAGQERRAEFLKENRRVPESDLTQQASLGDRSVALRQALGLGDCVQY